eukprot:11444493-Ditylum_brightwellii.AAC.1
MELKQSALIQWIIETIGFQNARWLVEELADALSLDQPQETLVSTVWEDNNGTLILANSPLQ